MKTKDDVALLRVTGTHGGKAVVACVAGSPIGLPGIDDHAFQCDCSDEPSVVMHCPTALQLTDPADVSALAAWLSAAAVWLQIQILEKEAT